MSVQSPLHGSQPNAVSVCGRVVQKGKTVTVPATAIGARERKLEAAGKIKIRPSNEAGKVQITCTV